VLGALCVGAAIACNDAGTVVPGGQGNAAGRVFDLGGGVTATLGDDGAFSIVSSGATLLATPPGTPLLARTSDPDDPDGWHDPTKPDTDLTVLPVDPSSVGVEVVPDGSSTRAIHLVVPEQAPDTALLTVSLAADASFVTGLGEQFAHVSAAGRISPMYVAPGSPWESDTNEAHVPVPFLVSSAGWGLFVRTREAGAFDVAATDPTTTRATFEGRTLDVWFFVDADPLAVVARYDRLAGLPRPLPRWALSLLHWRHWAGPDDVLSVATEYRQRHIPTSALWFDDGWQTALNTSVPASSVFGDVQSTMATLASLGYRVMAWTSPYLEKPAGGSAPPDPAQVLYAQADAAHDFVQDGEGNDYAPLASPIKGGAGVIDFTSPNAQAFWEQQVAQATRAGIRGFKCDYGEDFVPDLLGARDPVAFADGTTAHTARLFPIEEHATYHAVLDEAFPGDGALIVRASSWGGASQADIVWPGDLDPRFEHQGDTLAADEGTGLAVGGLPAVVVDAQTLSVSGFPAFGSDTAGYRHQPTRESTLRWMEHTALSVIMQVYEDGARLPWLYDDAAAEEYREMASLHQALEPYNAVLMTAAQTAGAPPIRPLPLAFPGDPGGAAAADSEYLLGPDLLVAPVLEAGASSRSVHLPPGKWVHWWSDTVYEGPSDVTIGAPLGSPPLFARAGGLVPMLPDGIDTLVDATAPGVVPLAAAKAEMRARAWPAGTSSVVLDDGSSIVIEDGSGGVTVTWESSGVVRNLTVDVDVRTRTGSSGPIEGVTTVSGPALMALSNSSESAVEASTSPAWATNAAAGDAGSATNPGSPATATHVWLRFVGSGAALLEVAR
jgi:alpha-D-xyloside xylohydrolase